MSHSGMCVSRGRSVRYRVASIVWRMADLIFTSSNQLMSWLRRIEALKTDLWFEPIGASTFNRRNLHNR